MAQPTPPPYVDVTGIARTDMKINKQETIAEYDGNARPGELVVDLTTYNLYIGNADGNLNGFSGGGGTNYANANLVAYLNTGLAGNIIPSANNVYSLGSPTRQWASIYVSANTLYLGATAVSSDGTGLLIGGEAVVTANTPITGNVEADYFIGDGSLLTNLPAGNYSNSNVAAYLPTYSGNVTTITATGNIAANFFIGNGSQLTGIATSAAVAATNANVSNTNSNVANLTTSLSNTNSNVSNVASNVANLTTSLSNTNSNVANLTTSVTNTNSNVANTNSNVANLTTSITNTNSNVANTNSNVSNLSTSVTNTNSNVANTNSNVANLSTSVTNTNSNVSNLSTSLSNTNSNVANVAANVTSLSGNVYNNSNVAAFLLTATGNISANYFVGNGRQLTSVSTSFENEIHVAQNGNDTSGDGTINYPYFTIQKGVDISNNPLTDRRTVVIHPGTYIENVTVTNNNTQLITYNLTGASTTISGTLTLANNSQRVSGLKITNLIIAGNTTAYINSSTVTGQFTKSGSGYAEISDVDLSVSSNVQVTGGGQVTIDSNKILNLRVANASASVNLRNVSQVYSPQVTAGTLSMFNCFVQASGSTANAITTSAGSVLQLFNTTIYNLALTAPARISVGGFYQLSDVQYDRANSSLGTSLGAISFFQTANVDSLVSSGNIEADYFIGDGSLLTNLPAGNYSNSNVAAYLPTYSGNVTTITATGTIYAVGNVAGNVFIGNGSQLTGIVTFTDLSNTNSNVSNLSTSLGNTNSNVSNLILDLANTNSNVSNTNSNVSNLSSNLSNTDSNVSNTNSNVSNVASNVTTLQGQVYTNSNTATFLAAFGSNTITTTGNISVGTLAVTADATITGNLTVNGTTTTVNSNTVTINDKFINVANNASTSTLADGGGLGVGPVGTEYATLTFNNTNTSWDTNISVSVTGNVFASGVISATGNIRGGNLNTAGNISTTNISLTGNPSTLTFGDVPVTNRYYVDATRTDTYTQNGSQSRPFKTISGAQAAIATAISGGLNPEVEPIYIILLSNVTENVTLVTNHVYLVGQNGQIHQPIILAGNVTVNPTSGTLSSNHFSITGIEIVGGTDGKAIYVTGTSPLRLSLQDVWITANGNAGAGLYQDNTGTGTYTHGGPLKVSHNGTGDVYCFDIRKGTASFETVETSGATQVGAAGPGATLTFNNSQLDANGDVVVETYGNGVVVVTNSVIKNSAADSFGVKLNAVANVAGTVSVGQSAFNVPAGTGSAVWLDPNTTPGLSGVLAYAGVTFYPSTNTTVSATLIPAPLTTLAGVIASPIFAGSITSTTTGTWTLTDNSSSSLAINTSGKTGLLTFVTTNGAEGVTASGFVSVVGNVTGGNISTAGKLNVTGNVSVTGLVAGGYVRTLPKDVANLIPAGTANITEQGTRSFVTDADTRTWGNLVTGGGANIVPVWTDGTDWYIG